MTNKAKDTNTTVAPGIELSEKERDEARKEGALDAFKEGGKQAVILDTGTTADDEALAEAERLRVAPDIQSTFLAPLLDLPIDTLVERMTNDKVAGFIGFEDVKGLLHLERSGKNRDIYVDAMCKRLGIDDPRDVTSAGPPYTNKVGDLNHLGDR